MALQNDGDVVRGLGFVALYAASLEEQVDNLLLMLEPMEPFPESEQRWPTLAILAVELVQVVVLWLLALALGWEPDPHASLLVAIVLGTVACAGLGLCLAGRLKALATLAAANGLYLVLLLLSGMVIPLEELPGPVRAVARALPSGALAEAVRGAVSEVATPGRAWAVLAGWAVAAPVLATRLFRWDAEGR